MPLLPTRRFFALFAGAALLFVLGPAPALAVDALLVAALLLDAALVPRRSELEVERTAPARVALGGSAPVTVTLRNHAARASAVLYTDDVPPPLEREGPETLEAAVGAGREATLEYAVRAAARGTATVGDAYLRLAGPLGLARVQRRVALADRVQVQPGVLEVRRFRLLGLRDRRREAGLRNLRMRGESGSFESLREYVPGDDPRTIDWKATARRSAVMVRRYEAERNQSVLLAIDAGRLMTERLGERERIDYALSAALLLADVAAHQGDRVGVMVFSDRVEQYLPPSRLPLACLSELLAGVEPRLVESNYPLAFGYLARQLRRRSLLVLFTDVIDAGVSSALLAHLARTAHRHLPLAVALRNPAIEAAAGAPVHEEPDAFRRAAAEELLHARAAALAAMQRAGVLVADARPQDAAPALVNRYLQVKERGTL
ncbi:MAG TPA: DUF58 domain-containing protein [Longimicrobiaceae bacterium]|nr:DUF58 domain-containing protein [Longimicrobiaceae bacterium]